jgi:hypothetical protein
MPAHGPNALATLSVALLFCAIFLFGGRAAYRPGQRGRRRFISFAAGISVGYTFVHVLPALGRMREIATQSQTGFRGFFPEYSVYLWTMAGFMVFYGLETMAAGRRRGPEHRGGDDGGAASWQSWVHIGGFALYAWLLTYMMVWTGKGALSLCLFGAAMGMHIFSITCNLSRHHREVYDRRGALLPSSASLAGWACGLTLDIPGSVLVNLVAVVAGGVILNAAIAELPKEREGRFWYFLAGAAVYSALLLVLSHFEKGGN